MFLCLLLCFGIFSRPDMKQTETFHVVTVHVVNCYCNAHSLSLKLKAGGGGLGVIMLA